MIKNTKNINLREYLLECLNESNLVDELMLDFHEVSFKKNKIIQDNDQVPQYLFYINSGITRHFFHSNQKEFTSWFSKESDFMANSGFFTQKPVHEIIVALEDIHAYAISYSDFDKFCKKSHSLERFVRKSLAEQLYLLDQHISSNILLSAKERYDKFVIQFPDIVLRVPLIYIASFLGITPETLSRVRASK
jgi:CRP-like cAMP-binding protein